MTNPIVSISGAIGEQFGRSVFTSILTFKQAEHFCEVHQEVQRKLNKARVKAIFTYIIKGLHPNNLCFFTSLTTTARGLISYDENKGLINLDVFTRLSVNDGQHRYEAIRLALKYAREMKKKAKGKEEKEIANQRLNQIENMCIPVVIFDNVSEIGEQQLFHDLNLLASKPTKSISLKFDSNDLYTRMAKELKDENDVLVHFGVDTERTILSEKHEELMVLSTLRNMISYIIAGTANDKSEKLSLDNFDQEKEFVSEALTLVLNSLPEDCNDRKKYIVGTAATLQGIGKYINHIRKTDESSVTDLLMNLGNIDWSHNNTLWETGNPNGGNYGGKYDSEKGKFIFSGTGSGVTGICQALIDHNKIIQPV